MHPRSHLHRSALLTSSTRSLQFTLAFTLAFTLLAPEAAGRARRIEVQGHRGARARFPENTLPAFRHAIAVGADTLELDVQVSADDRLIVVHDPVVSPKRCLGPGGKRLRKAVPIRSLKAKALARFDCGSLPNPRFPAQQRVKGAGLPTLDEVLALVVAARRRGRRVSLNIETKLVPARPRLSPTPTRFARLVVAALRRRKLLDRSTLQSFDYRTLVAARKLAPKLSIALLTDGGTVDYVALARRYHAQIISPHRLWITARDVRRLHAAGVRVIPWTVNDPAGWRRLLRAGVDGIITDDPAALIAFLRTRKRR